MFHPRHDPRFTLGSSIGDSSLRRGFNLTSDVDFRFDLELELGWRDPPPKDSAFTMDPFSSSTGGQALHLTVLSNCLIALLTVA